MIKLCVVSSLLFTTMTTYNNDNDSPAMTMTAVVNAFVPMTTTYTSSSSSSYYYSSLSNIKSSSHNFLELKATKTNQENNADYEGSVIGSINNRRSFLSSIVATTTTATIAIASSQPAYGKWILDEETGDYVEDINNVAVEEEVDWKLEWKARYQQMSTMSKEEIFQAGRGGGNLDKKDLINESNKSRKRRALSNCRDKPLLKSKFPTMTEKTCIQRILENENENDLDFILN